MALSTASWSIIMKSLVLTGAIVSFVLLSGGKALPKDVNDSTLYTEGTVVTNQFEQREDTKKHGYRTYDVYIISSTDQYVLQDCVKRGKGKSGLHIGVIKGTDRLVLFCGHRPDRVEKTVQYNEAIGI